MDVPSPKAQFPPVTEGKKSLIFTCFDCEAMGDWLISPPSSPHGSSADVTTPSVSFGGAELKLLDLAPTPVTESKINHREESGLTSTHHASSADLQILLQRAKGSPYEQSVRKFVASKISRDGSFMKHPEYPEYMETIIPVVTDLSFKANTERLHLSFDEATGKLCGENDRIDSARQRERVEQMSRPNPRHKWKEPTKLSFWASTNNMGRQRPPPKKNFKKVANFHSVGPKYELNKDRLSGDPASARQKVWASLEQTRLLIDLNDETFDEWLKSNSEWAQQTQESIAKARQAHLMSTTPRLKPELNAKSTELAAQAYSRMLKTMKQTDAGPYTNPNTGDSFETASGVPQDVFSRLWTIATAQQPTECKKLKSAASEQPNSPSRANRSFLSKGSQKIVKKKNIESSLSASKLRPACLSTPTKGGAGVMTGGAEGGKLVKNKDKDIAPEDARQQGLVRSSVDAWKGLQPASSDCSIDWSSPTKQEFPRSTGADRSFSFSKSERQVSQTDFFSPIKTARLADEGEAFVCTGGEQSFRPTLVSSSAQRVQVGTQQGSFDERTAKRTKELRFKKALAGLFPEPGPGHFNVSNAKDLLSSPTHATRAQRREGRSQSGSEIPTGTHRNAVRAGRLGYTWTKAGCAVRTAS
jgi:hypothetical protein